MWIILILLLFATLVYLAFSYGFIISESADMMGKKLLTVITVQNPKIPIDGGFDRRQTSIKKSFPWVAGIVIDIEGDGNEEIFLGGGEDQDDVLLYYDGEKLVNRIQGTRLSSKSPTYGGVSVDLNGDGYSDLIVARQDGVYLYLNNKDRTFSMRKLLDEKQDRVPVAISVADIDKDGQLDIYVSNFIHSKDLMNYQFHNPEHSKGNVLLKGLGNGEFTDITVESETETNRNTFTSVFVDLNNDQLPDLVVAQDAGEVEIYENLGDGRFQRRKVDTGFGFWMGIAAGDYDNDGDIDIFASNISRYTPSDQGVTRPKNKAADLRLGERLNHNHILLRNDGGFEFTDVTDKFLPKNYGFAWGSVFDDLNMDGLLDLLFSVNYVQHPLNKYLTHPQPVLIQTAEENEFKQNYAFSDTNFGHTPLLVDIDRDGRKDVMWVNVKGPVQVFSNQDWKENNYINVKLPPTSEFVNARITLDTKNGKKFIRENIQGGVGFGSDQSEVHSFGLGENMQPAKITVETIYGKKYTHDTPKKNTTILMTISADRSTPRERVAHGLPSRFGYFAERTSKVQN